MTLDEEIVERILVCNREDEKDLRLVIKGIVLLCLGNQVYVDGLSAKGFMLMLERNINSYECARRTLEKMGIFVLKKDGFKNLLAEELPDIKRVIPYLFEEKKK